VKHTTAHSASFIGPLFVVGMWRSGTSLLYALLNQHPEIALLYEGDLPLLTPLFWFTRPKKDWVERWDFWNSALQRHHIDHTAISRTVDSFADAMSFAGREYARKKSATIWGCKSPNYYDSMSRLSRQFPDARFIVIWRDPADICRSILRAAQAPTWFRKAGIAHRALFGYRQMKQQADQLIASGVPVHQIEYAELVQNPANVMESVCHFLGVPMHERMLNLAGADRSAIYEGNHHALVKSEKIVASRERPEVLPPALEKKLRRYISLWQKEFGGHWPNVPPTLAKHLAQPGRLERYFDFLKYRALRGLDFIIVVAFCFAPLRFLRKYRDMKHDRQQAADVRGNMAPTAESQAD
jgi:hypothetical protein